MVFKECGLCANCGLHLEGRPDERFKHSIKGNEAMEYRHVKTKSADCVIYIEDGAAPYSNWGMYDEYRAAN